MTIEEIRHECSEVGIGEQFWSLLVRVCSRVARKRMYEVVAVFNDGLEWSEEAFEDLAQQVVLERLLPNDQDQLKYVLLQAKSEHELAALLAFQVKRVLGRRRGTHASDRLLKRVRALAESDSYAVWKTPGDEWIGLERVADPRPLAHLELAEAVALIADIPRLPVPKAATRESMVYSPSSLQTLVRRLLQRFEVLDLNSLREIFERFLTPRFPAGLQEDEEIPDFRESPESEAQRREMEQQTVAAANAIDPIHRRILVAKMNKVSDSTLAEDLGRSRPWIAQEAKRVVERVQSIITELPVEFQEEAAGLLFETLVTIDEETQ